MRDTTTKVQFQTDVDAQDALSAIKFLLANIALLKRRLLRVKLVYPAHKYAKELKERRRLGLIRR